ncbi:hypothetical protein RND81_11G056700 [Saponaria officinalis]|uniref:Uncharacterized protein n=1 Tax=Saponaria officinalis TaxID=3572 RepID=A0AAW1HIB8_SAPOF
MATSSKLSPYKKSYFLLIILLTLIIINICVTTRHGRMLVVEDETTNSIYLKHLRRKHGINDRGLVFNSLPKGRHDRSSGPSKRHNAAEDSTHN